MKWALYYLVPAEPHQAWPGLPHLLTPLGVLVPSSAQVLSCDLLWAPTPGNAVLDRVPTVPHLSRGVNQSHERKPRVLCTHGDNGGHPESLGAPSG